MKKQYRLVNIKYSVEIVDIFYILWVYKDAVASKFEFWQYVENRFICKGNHQTNRL